MWPAIAFVAGVAIGGAVLAAALGEETEEEKRKQERLRADYQKQKKEFEAKHQELVNERKVLLAQERAEAIRQERLARQASYEETRKQVQKLVVHFRGLAEERLAEKKKLVEEIWQTQKRCRDSIRAQNSNLRKNALEGLSRDLEEAAHRIFAYCLYLEKYIRRLDKHTGIKFPPEVPYHLPENRLYKGRLIYLKKSELREHGELPCPEGDDVSFSDKYYFTEFEFIKDLEENFEIPLMCDHFKGKPDYEWTLSAKKGHFKHILKHSPRTGLLAKVTGRSEKGLIELEFANSLPFTLHRSQLENPARIPPPGSTIMVYPLKWDYLLRYPAQVSARAGDSYLICAFDEIPIIFTEEQWSEFEAALLEKGLEQSKGEWKLAPFSEQALPNLESLKFQLGSQLCFSAHVGEENSRIFLEFERLLENDQYLHADNIFFAMECELVGCLKKDMKELPEEAFENMKALYLRALAEFKIQLQIQRSGHGLQYFNQWTELTSRMVSSARKGQSYTTPFEVLEADSRYVLKVLDVESMRRFINLLNEQGKWEHLEYIIELEKDTFIEARLDAELGLITFSTPVDLGEWLHTKKELTIYRANYPVPELRQISALKSFREGRVANPVLQPFALDASRIVSNRTQNPIHLKFNNRSIEEDPSQANAVRNALAEKDIYLIQGPPGTGKTTVIREVIEQEFKADPLKRILVASQANVAVDNVLRNFQAKGLQFIRCGQKVAPDLETHSFPHMAKVYAESVKARLAARPHDKLLRYWYDNFIREGESPLQGSDWFLRNFQIVGATCVGLADPRTSRGGQSFDLVIVDEAGKALPGELLIPYIQAHKIILLGDHRQLPPVLPPDLDLSDNENYDEDNFENLASISMFQRIFEACPDTNKTMLKTQYRMPEVLGTLISGLFYEGKVRNAPGTGTFSPLLDWGHKKNIVFFEHRYPEESTPGRSITNKGEADLVTYVLKKLEERASASLRIAIITPYKGQKRLLEAKIKDINTRHDIAVDTVDAFQGDERDIVFFCTTRTRKQTPFFSDARRINVALSRAKNQLYIFGSMDYFKCYGSAHFLPKIANYFEKYGDIVTLYTGESAKKINAHSMP